MIETKPAGPGADLFGRYDFQDLWTESALGTDVVEDASANRGDEIDPKIKLFALLKEFIVVDDQGVWIAKAAIGVNDQGEKLPSDDVVTGVELWSPQIHAAKDAGHWRSKPALPFPFTPGELAAFMLAGPGWWLGETFGGLDLHAPDLSQLPVGRDLQEAAQRSMWLLTLAWGAYHAAVRVVGPRPVHPADAMCHDDDAAGGVDRADDEAEGTAVGPAWSAEKERAWLGAMCRRLLDRSEAAVAPKPILRGSTQAMPDNERRVGGAIEQTLKEFGLDAIPPFKRGKVPDPFKTRVEQLSGLSKGAFVHAWKAVTKGKRPLKPPQTG